ncbi:MAG: signal recognition particle-docking protein FtsY [Christensenellales bacterium]
MSLFGLKKTRDGLLGRMASLFGRRLDEEFYEELEETLILADVGVETSVELVDRLRCEVKTRKITDTKQAREVMVELVAEMMDKGTPEFTYPLLILTVGVNGVGKTTAIGRLANQFHLEGKKVLLAAGDTFRAAAAEQLGLWAERTDSQFVRGAEGGDPAAVVFDAISAAKARHCDVVLCDTAGRLHNRKNLMDELGKIRKVVSREFEGCVKAMLVLDATTGLNGVEQAKAFSEMAQVDGIALTKIDGSAKGGVALAIAHQYELPVWYCGTGETKDDWEPFEAKAFAKALFGEE